MFCLLILNPTCIKMGAILERQIVFKFKVIGENYAFYANFIYAFYKETHKAALGRRQKTIHLLTESEKHIFHF